ncbi:MAG: hypothetical protein GF349_01280 [Candidatus Magasanikbacteria bacterium]|nr:hypothetical protein [Candidatus Magasanikbacteria bacterium]
MKLKNGTIMILGPDKNNIARKVFDLKIMQTFPIISIDKDNSILVTEDSKDISISGYDHLSIPPDINLHLTNNKTLDNKHLNFVTNFVDYDSGLLKKDFLHIFTWMSKPISNYREPHGTWNQAQIIFPPKDNLFSENTAIFVDFFVHNFPHVDIINDYILVDKMMRLVGDNSGYIIGPYEFEQVIRGLHRFIPKFSFSLRFGYYENLIGSSKIFIPLKIKEKNATTSI